MDVSGLVGQALGVQPDQHRALTASFAARAGKTVVPIGHCMSGQNQYLDGLRPISGPEVGIVHIGGCALSAW
jgi:hypothetical protein